MKSLNNKGFMLMETLVVSTFLIITLMFMYVQFSTIKKSYDVTFKYNLIDGLYGVKNIEKFLKSDNLSSLLTQINTVDYVNITNCGSPISSAGAAYCNSLFKSLDVKTVLFTKENLTNLRNSEMPFDQTLQDYIRFVKYEKVAGGRIIVQYNNGTFASLRVIS